MTILKIYEKFNNKIDSILDKIIKFGINSINNNEKKFLNAYSIGDKEDMEMIINNDNQSFFTSNDNKFKFIYSHTVIENNNICYYGILTVPDLYIDGIGLIVGELDGHICVMPDKQSIPFFEKDDYDVLEFCNGIEYELDNFIDYVVYTIEDEKTTE